MNVPAKYKKLWLRDQIIAAMNQFCEDVDELYGSDCSALQIETEMGEWRWNWFKNRQLRIDVMGDPLWYCEIIFTGPTTMTKQTVDGRWEGGMHEFAVSLFFEYRPGVSTDLFENMTDGQGSAREGLLLYLRNKGVQRVTFPIDDGETSYGDIIMSIRETGDEETYRDQRSVVTMNPQASAHQTLKSEQAHLLTFRVNIVDVV